MLVIYILALNLIFIQSKSTKISVEPINRVIAGSKVTFTCKVDNILAPILWKKNNLDIGEECNIYRNPDRFSCRKNGDTYTLEILSVDYDDSGDWSCSHLIHNSHVSLDVFVPITINDFKISTHDPKETIITQPQSLRLTKVPADDSFAGSGSKKSNQNEGTKGNPIDLTGDNSVNSLTIQCKSSCSSPGTSLRMFSRNSTWKANLNNLLGPQSLRRKVERDDCSPGLERQVQTVEFSCEDRTIDGVVVPLVGLNRISCLADNSNLDDILRQSNFEKSLSTLDDELILLSQELGINVNSKLSPQQLYRLRASRFSPDCVNGDGKNLGSCVYVMCPGKRTQDYFTLGEKIALGVASFLVVLLILFIVHITRVQKKSKRKDFFLQQNQIPSLYQDVQLML